MENSKFQSKGMFRMQRKLLCYDPDITKAYRVWSVHWGLEKQPVNHLRGSEALILADILATVS